MRASARGSATSIPGTVPASPPDNSDEDDMEDVLRDAERMLRETGGVGSQAGKPPTLPGRSNRSVVASGPVVPFANTRTRYSTASVVFSSAGSSSASPNSGTSAPKPKTAKKAPDKENHMTLAQAKKALKAAQHPKITNVIENAVLYNRTKCTPAALCCPCYRFVTPSRRERLHAFLHHTWYTALQIVATAVILVAADLSVAFIDKNADPAFEIMFGFLFLFFLMDLILMSALDRKQVYTALWWLDLLACLSIILEMRTVTAWLVETVEGGNGDGSTDGVSIVEAGKAARAGTRVGRFMRLIRVVRLVRIMRFLQFIKRWRIRMSCVLRPGEKSVSMHRAATRVAKHMRKASVAGFRRLSQGAKYSYSATNLTRRGSAKVVPKQGAKLPLTRSMLPTKRPERFSGPRGLDGLTTPAKLPPVQPPVGRRSTAMPVLNKEIAQAAVEKHEARLAAEEQREPGRKASMLGDAAFGEQTLHMLRGDKKVKRSGCLPCFSVEEVHPLPEGHGVEDSDGEEEEEAETSSIGSVVNARIRQNVIIGIIMIFILVPLLEVAEVDTSQNVSLDYLEALEGSAAQATLLARYHADHGDETLYLKIRDTVYVDNPARRDELRAIEMRTTESSSGLSTVSEDISATRRQEAVLSFVQTQVIILLLALQAVTLNRVVNRMLIRPVERITNHLKPWYSEAIRFLCDADESKGWNVKFGANDGEQLSTKIMLAAIEAMRGKLNNEAKSAFRMRTVMGRLRRLSQQMGGVKPVFQEIRRKSLMMKYGLLGKQRSKSVGEMLNMPAKQGGSMVVLPASDVAAAQRKVDAFRNREAQIADFKDFAARLREGKPLRDPAPPLAEAAESSGSGKKGVTFSTSARQVSAESKDHAAVRSFAQRSKHSSSFVVSRHMAP